MRVLLLVLISLSSMAEDLLPREFSIHAAAVDSAGFIYLAGDAGRSGIAGTPGALLPDPRACESPDSRCANSFVAKVSSSGDGIVWLTYFRGNGDETISAMAVAPDGNLLLAGSTRSTDLFPGLLGYRTAPAGLFLARLSAEGDRLLSGTYFGGDGSDAIVVMKIDANGNVYVAGTTNSSHFPTTPGAYQETRGSGPPPDGFGPCAETCPDQFVAKFDSTLSKLVFSTLLGTSVEESTSDLALGPDGSLYLSGARGPFGGQGPGPTYPILIHLNSSATAKLYDTRIEGTFPHGGPLVLSPDGSAYISTFTPRWPITVPRSMTWKVDPLGSLLWGREFPGVATSMALNSEDEIVLAGQASDLRLRQTDGAPRACLSSLGGSELRAIPFVARLRSATGDVAYAGFLNARQSWLVDADRVLADAAYVGLPRFAILPAGLPPKGTVTCIASAAGFDSKAVAPGEVLSVFGSGIGPDREYPAELDATGVVRSALGGVTVSVDGRPAPILYASPGQIDFVTPFAIPASGTVSIVVRRNEEILVTAERSAAVSHPALFVTNGLRAGPLLALNEDASLNGDGNPALSGSLVSVFATGLGAMSPSPTDGALGGDILAVPQTLPSVQVTGWNSMEVPVEFVGSSPGLVQGLVRIDFRIPPAIIPRDGSVSVSIGMNSGSLFVH